MAGTGFDKYLPQEGFNTVFSDLRNQEVEARPSKKGLWSPNFWFRKRDGLTTKKDQSGNGQWDTLGNVVTSKVFNGKIYTYTTLGYVYTFDGENVDLILANPSSITALVTNADYVINQQANQNAYLQEFTFADNVALQRVDVQLKKSSLAGSIPSVSAYIALAATPNVPIAYARADIGADELTTSYATKSFYYNAPQLTGGTKYVQVIVGANTNNDRTISLAKDSAGSYASHNVYMYNGTTWAVQTGLMYFGIYATKAATIDQTNYDEDIIQLSYVGARRYPDAATEFTVTAYSNTTFEITVSGTPFTSSFIGKYIYVSSGGTRVRQQRGIADSSANNKITLSSGLAIDLQAGDKFYVYDKIEAQLWFPQLRKGTSDDDKKYLVSIDRNNEVRYIYMPERKRLAFWDNRVVMLAKDNQSLLFSSNIDYEIPITDKTLQFSNENVINMVPYGGYLIIFFERKIGIVKKEVIDATTQAFVYTYQDVLDISLYSKESFVIKSGSTLYMVANDNGFYSVKFSAGAGSKIDAELQPEGDAIDNYLSEMVGGTIKIYYDTQKIYIVHRKTDGTSNVYKYSSFLKGWIVDDYAFSGNFFNLYRIVNAKRYTVYSNRFVEMTGLTDDGASIKQKTQLYGPVQEMMNHVTLLHVKVRLGFDGVNGIGGTATLRIGGNHITKRTWDISKLDIVRDINADIDADGTIGSTLQGGIIWGGEGMEEIGLYNVYAEMIDVSFKVGLKGTYFTIDLENETDKQLYIGGVLPIVNGMNVNVVSNANVLAH